MNEQHQWVIFGKGRIQVTGCANCGQVMLATNKESQCHRVSREDNMLHKNGYRMTGSIANYKVA